MPTFRPLIGDDKNDIIDVARRIGTFATSIERQDDCCSMFMPPQPVIRSTVERAEKEEAKYDVAALVDGAIERAERLEHATMAESLKGEKLESL
jgi:thiamine biosynthesis protein ThiI